MSRNARPLEWAQWRLLYHGGSREDVLTALSAYQNADGGFGHALEPDNWNLESTPYVTLYGVKLLRSVGVEDGAHPMMAGALRYFEHTADCSTIGWHFNVPGNNNYAHAPWWGYSGETSAAESPGLTAGIAGCALHFAAPGSSLFALARKHALRVIQTILTEGASGDMGVGGGIELLRDIEAAGLVADFPTEAFRSRLKELADRSIERDVEKWQYYGVLPSNYIDSPASPWLTGNEDILQTELDYLMDTLPAGGIWGIPWTWFDNGPLYPREWAISENWWRAIKGIEKVRLLQAFGRLQR
jgi:hypothetical protein